MKKKKSKKQMQMFQLGYAMARQLPNSSTGINETDSAEQGGDLGTLEKKRRESNIIASQRVQNANYNEMKQEFEMRLQRRQNKELSKRVERLEKQLAKVHSEIAEYTDMESRINEEIGKKTKCIPRLKKKISMQGKVIKQIEDIFLSVAVSKGNIPEGTSFSKMIKLIKRKKKMNLIYLLDNKQ